MKLVVMIPAYNEEKTIGKVIKEIPREIEGIKEVEILVIDDGSRDSTAIEARKAGADYIISHGTNRGLGNAFKTGVENALKLGGDVIVNIDADGQFDPRDIPRLVTPILHGEADCVTGSRFLDKSFEPNIPWIKKFGNQIFIKVVNWLTHHKFTDTQCGLRAYSREAALKLNLFGSFTYTQEVLLDLLSKGLAIKEIPVEVRYYSDRRSRVVKNPILYGLGALGIIIRTVRDIRPLAFFGSIGIAVFLSGLISGLWLFVRWLLTGRVSPYTSLVTFSGVLMIIGFILIILALIADMQGRQRKLLEEISYYNKLRAYETQRLNYDKLGEEK